MKSKNPGHKAPLLCASTSQLLRHELEDSYICLLHYKALVWAPLEANIRLKKRKIKPFHKSIQKRAQQCCRETVIYTSIQF